MSGKGLQHGKGVDACPEGSLCLYRDEEYNTLSSEDRQKILVIPDGEYIDDFADYGFNYTDDGVSSVVNKTGKHNTLFSKAKQQGDELDIDAAARMPDLRKIPHQGGGNWNDRAESALAAPPTPLTVSQKLRGHWMKGAGPSYIYSFELTINARKEGIEVWTLSFGVEKGVTLDPDWATTFKWATIVKDGSDGTVVIKNTDPTHKVAPNKPLPVDIQLLCPGQSTTYETLHNPTATENQ
ncbi:peptidase inhibitor family I36 protein [Goodfellowiella coeruleoviolacea]|uniref:Uncharacterized protein n=1 Tax=Goodfellowiella coeruleoviolacea TaxID=334858 RepID=A0AAE3GIH9_9PSEU|nr:peptidase inhibitor family I36 protein [Goodfellowiella coeruleoviolacea]MCP2167934.1 hypothetical protein [Goodfellowiella coeruleoviolacea]